MVKASGGEYTTGMDPVPFVEDILPKTLLFGTTLRSPVARGKLKRIECPRLPGSYFLITALDIPGKNQLDDLPVPVLAHDELSYSGEAVGILVGPDQAKLEEYAERIVIHAEESETPVFTSGSCKKENILAERHIKTGNTEEVFAKAKTILSGEYQTGIQEHLYAEPVGAVAIFTPSTGQLTIRTATQWPFQVKRSASLALNIPPALVSVESTAIGVHLDGKIWYPSLVACHAALASFISKKPVRIILTRAEDFLYSPKRNAAEIQIRSALGEGGEITGAEIGIQINVGAQGVFTDEILDRTCLGALGAYRIPNLTIRAAAFKTNIPPQGPLSGFGLAQGFFAMERHVSRIADTFRQGPGEWRKNNHLRRGEGLRIGVPIRDTPPLEQLLDTSAAMSDYYRKWASYELLRHHRTEAFSRESGEALRGIGIAAAWQGNGFLYAGADKGLYSVELTLEKDGSLEIKTSMVTSNDSYTHIWGNIASDILAIDSGMVRVVSGHTEQNPDSGPASLSRNVAVLTKLVESACLAIRKQRFRDPLPITVRRRIRPAKGGAWEQDTLLFDKNSLSHLSWGAAVVEVEIDPVTYSPKIRGAWLGIDGGKILSEERARRCLRGGIVHALGWASSEKLDYVEGRIPRETMHDYNLPDPLDIPPIYIDFLWNDTGDAKGIGELPFNCVPAAFVQAVSQAMDHPFERIPLTALDIWEAGKLKKEEKPQ
jgi:CO/xanthine dehydrogenase Mo-binding subunit